MTGPVAWYRRKRIYLLMLLAVLLVLYLDQAFIGKWLYPLRFEAEIVRHSREQGVDPILVAAIIRVESNFRTDKRSPKGAVGLMQIMPQTAEWIARQGKDDPSMPDRLEEASVNIRYGAWYLGSLRRQLSAPGLSREDEIARIAAAYNAGPGNVGRWLAEGTWDGTFAGLESIPFGETRHYVARVHYYYLKYERIYPELRDETQRGAERPAGDARPL